MRQHSRPAADREDLWSRYRDNFPRHCIGLSRYLQTRLMHTLTEQLGHTQLRLSFEPFIVLVGDRGARLTELAQWLSISKQACNQTVNQMEVAGYLCRVPDSRDGRAKLVVLTDRGHQLVQQGSMLVAEIEQECAACLGEVQMQRLLVLLQQLYRGLRLPLQRVAPAVGAPSVALAGLLPRISAYMMQRLMELTMAKGHPGLRMSHGQVLTLIGLEGGRIAQMARIQQVSKQAIAAVATELEQLGYIRREPDAADARQLVLKFTDNGLQLLSDSVESVVAMEREFLPLLECPGGRGVPAVELAEMQRLVGDLYRSLHLEEEVFGNSGAAQVDLQLLAARLTRQLGAAGAGQLAHMLGGENGVLS